jgi:hypothetical protein
MAFGGDIDVVTGPWSAGDEEEGLGGYEFDMILIEGRVVFDHL